MEVSIDMGDVEKKLEQMEKNVNAAVKKTMRRLAIEAERNAKETIATFVNSKGNQQGVNTGHFAASVKSRMFNKGLSFRLSDGVPYGIYHEFGTVSHWVPFFDSGGNITSLGEWALQHFTFEEGGTFQVIGKKGKPLKKPSRLSRIDKLKQMKGIMVKLDEMSPFRKALSYAASKKDEIFREEIDKAMNIQSYNVTEESAIGQAGSGIGMEGMGF